MNGGAPVARLVVVDGHRDDPAEPAGDRHQAARRDLDERLARAARQSVRDHVRPLGWLLLATAPAALPAAWALPGLLAGAMLAVSGALLSQLGPGRRIWRDDSLPMAALAAGIAGLLLAAAFARPGWQAPWAAWAMTVGYGLALATAPNRRASAAGAALIGATSAVLAVQAEALPWALLGLAATALAALASRRRRQLWRQSMRGLIDRADRVRELEHERDAAWRSEQDKTRFLAIASHDLRQPVHALGLFAATLQKRLQRSPDEPLARNLLRAVDGLERSFNAMLDVSRLDAGALTPRLQTFPLRDLFRRLQMRFGGQAELAGLGLRFSPGGKSVHSDPQLLERILGNLIQNAVKYTTEGGIVVVARSTTSHLNIEVWDTGCGIAPAELPRIFEEFYQVGRGERDRSHGLGMGLAIVKRLALLLDHRLEVASVQGRGTMFRVGVPLGELPGIQEEVAPVDTLPMTIDRPRMVLVVDDEDAIREGLRGLLLEWGFQVMTAATAAQAEAAVSALEGNVDLVLSDLYLGEGIDGTDVVAAVRRLCAREVPAILITGETGRERLQRVAAGGDPVMFKPVRPRELFDAMQVLLQ